MDRAHVDPIAELVTSLERDGRVPLAWAIALGDSDPVRAAWSRSEDIAAMIRFAVRVGAGDRVRETLDDADAWLPRLRGTTARGDRVMVRDELRAAATMLRAGVTDAAGSRVVRAVARWPIARGPVLTAMRGTLPVPPTLGQLLDAVRTSR